MALRGSVASLLLLIGISSAAAAAPLSFSYVEGSYLSGEGRGNGSGVDSEGSAGVFSAVVAKQTYLMAEYSSRQLQPGGSYEPEFDFISAGIGFTNNLRTSPNLSSYVAFTYERADADHSFSTGGLTPTIFNENNTAEGLGVGVGVRGRPGGSVEISAAYRYLNYGKDADFSGSSDKTYDANLWKLGVVVPLPGALNKLAFTGGYQIFNDSILKLEDALIGLRLSF